MVFGWWEDVEDVVVDGELVVSLDYVDLCVGGFGECFDDLV